MKKSNGEGGISFKIRNGKKYYVAQVTIGKEENGKRIRKYKCSFIKREVIDWQNKILAELQSKKLSYSEQWTFKDLIEHYLFKVYKGEVRETTFEHIFNLLTTHIYNKEIANYKLSELNDSVMKSFFIKIHEENGSDIHNRLINRLNIIFNYAVRDARIMEINPIKQIKKIKRVQKTKQPWTEEEQLKIIDELKDTNTDNALKLLFASGLRRGEVTALEWKNYDGKGLFIENQVNYICEIDESGKKQYKTVLADTKTTNSNRYVPLPKEICNWLDKMKKSDGLMFPGKDGYLSKNILYKRLNRIQDKLGIERRNLHMTRHTYATRLFERGADPKTVQKLLGHSSIKTSMEIYIHVTDKRKETQVNLINDIFKN